VRLDWHKDVVKLRKGWKRNSQVLTVDRCFVDSYYIFSSGVWEFFFFIILFKCYSIKERINITFGVNWTFSVTLWKGCLPQSQEPQERVRRTSHLAVSREPYSLHITQRYLLLRRGPSASQEDRSHQKPILLAVLFLGFQAPALWENKCELFKPPSLWHFVIAFWVDWNTCTDLWPQVINLGGPVNEIYR